MLDIDGEHVRLVDETEAHALIRCGDAVGLGTKRRINAVRYTEQGQKREEPKAQLLPNGMVGQRYSHDRETRENPTNVWMLRRLRAKDPRTDLHMHLCFIASLTDCMSKADAGDLKRGLAVMRGLKRKDFD